MMMSPKCKVIERKNEYANDWFNGIKQEHKIAIDLEFTDHSRNIYLRDND